MTQVGIYVDGPNIEMGLQNAGEHLMLNYIGSVLVDYTSSLGALSEANLFIDEDYQFFSYQTKEDYQDNGFRFIESRSFKHLDRETGQFTFGKSLTDPTMNCAIVDRLHHQDCPDIFIVVSGDRDMSVVLDYIKSHGKIAHVLGEAHSLSNYLIEKCDELGFPCHVFQLIARTSGVLKRHKLSTPSRAEIYKERLIQADNQKEGSLRVEHLEQIVGLRSDEMNPNNDAYWQIRGFERRPADWKERLKEMRVERS